MSRTPFETRPRLAWLAVSVLGGDLAASRSALLEAVPLAWIAAILVVLAAARRPVRARGWLAIAALTGGALWSVHARFDRVRPPPGAQVDDRVPDALRGTVVAPVEWVADGQRFVLRLDRPAAMDVALTVRGARDLLPGDRLEVQARLRSGRGYRTPGALGRQAQALAAFGADATASVDLGEVAVLEGGWHWRRPAVALHQHLSDAVRERGGDPAGNAVARAVALGDRSGIDPDLDQSFRDGGVAHVLAVSGLHLGIVALLVFAVVRRSWGATALARRVDPSVAAAWIALGAALVYTLATGARVSTLRAFVVAAIVLGGIAMCRRARFIDALGLAAIALIAVDPRVIFDVSFQLSFAATATLALTLRRDEADPEVEHLRWWRRALRVLGRRAWQLAAASVWTSLATAPFTAMAFHRAAGGGLAVNLLVVPLVELIVLPLTLLGAVLGLVWNELGGVLIDVAVGAGAIAAELAGVAARVWPSTRVPPPTWLELAALGALWLAAVLVAQRRLRWRRGAAVGLAAMAVLAGSWLVTAHLAPVRSSQLEVTFLDVGQGDAAVVRLPGGAVWLIDAGGLPAVPAELDPAARRRLGELPGERSVVPFLEHQRIRAIDRVVLSHPHPDHYRGLRAVARAVPIRELWVAADGEGRAPADPEYHDLLDELRRGGTRIVHPLLDTPYIDHGVSLTALAPRFGGPRATTDPVVSINDDSLVVRLDYAGRSVLFAGDLEVEGEETLSRERPAKLRADVVKVAHHGSKTSSSAAFVGAVAPAYAVISCGVANQFGFPAPAVVERWQTGGATVLRTDLRGAVTAVISAGGGLWVETVD